MAITTTHVDIEIHVTYVDRDGPFIKFFAQTDKNPHLVERLLYQLREVLEYEETKPKTINDLNVGLICCAKFEDGRYYRAQIVSLEHLRQNRVTLLFIDHGNCTEVGVKDIRLNSKVIKLCSDERVQKILELPNLSREFYLGGIVARLDWDDNTLDILRQQMSNTNMLCSVCEVGGTKVILKIMEAKVDPLDILMQSNKGFEIPISTFIKKVVERKRSQLPNQFNIPPPTVVDMTKQPPPSRLPNLAQPPPVRMIPQGAASGLFQPTNQTIANRPPGMILNSGIPGVRRPEIPVVPQQALQFSTEMLAVGTTHPVFVSHVDDGPHSFAVQLQSDVQDILIKMMTDINNHEPRPITAPLNPGSICLSRYCEDNSLCRAIVTNVKDDKVKLYFADFGNSEVVPFSEIYEIPPQFVTPKVISHRFTLANIKGVIYTDQQKLLFKNLVANSSALHIRVTPPEANPLKQYCDLFLNCRNIKVTMSEMMQSMPPLRYIPPTLPLKGSKEKVVVPFVLNPGRFFVQMEKNMAELDDIMTKVANHCRTASFIPLSDLRAGDPCCALYPEDETWYRAEILKVYPDKVFINFVDYGNQEEVEHTNLRGTTADLVTRTRAQALVCCLKGYELRYNVSEEISNRLEELILEKSLTMHVLGSTDSNVLIVEMSDNGQDIGTLLDATPAHNTAQPPRAVPAAASANVDGSWEDTTQDAAPSNSWGEKKYSDSRAPSEEGGKSWRGQQQDTATRYNKGERRNDGPPFEKKYNKDEDDKPWNRGESRFNRDESRGGRFNKDDDGGGRFNRDEGKRFGERKGRFNDDDKGGRFNDDDKGGRFGDSESRGGRFNSTDEDKPWRKRDDDTGGRRNNRDDEGSWKRDRENNDGGWKDKDRASGGGWKGKDGGSGGSWREGGGGDHKNKFDGDSDFKRGRSFSRDTGDRSSFKKPWEKGSGDSYGKPIPKTPKPDTLGGIPHPTAKVGMTEHTQVVFTTSPSEFYVQLNSTVDELTQLMDKIAKACESGEATDMPIVQDKTACIAKYSEDQGWYRGFIEEKDFENAKVQFVDYGNQEKVPFNDIKVLPEDMSSLPAQAVKCRLYGVPETAELGAFTDLTGEKSLLTQFVAKNFTTKSFQVVLIDEESGSNINIAMGAEEEEVIAALSKMGATSLTVPQYPAGTSLTVQLTWFNNPSHFYVQPMASHPEFRAMMQVMQTVVRSGSVLQNNQLNVGDFVIARFKNDKVLYRALIKETSFLPMVQFLDYGNTESVDSGSVWAMEPQFATLPVQAFNCCLAGVLPLGDAWPQDASPLEQHFEADTLECSVVKPLENDSQHLVKLVKNGEDLAAKIIEAGLAASDVQVASELDTSLLVGQLLPVTVLRVEDDCSFSVQPLPDDVELQSLEAVAGEGIKCVVSNIREDASEEQLAQWKQLPANTNVIVLVDAVQNDGLQATVYDSEGQLLPMQVSEVPTVEKICPLSVFNMHQKVTIAHASEDGIFLHRVVFSDQLAELLQKLYEFYNESEQMDQEWIEGELCSAKSVSDEQWYRARILELGSDVKVQYLDYGNCETVPSSNVRKLDPSFYVPQAFALKVNLHVSWSVPIENLLELSGETEYNAVILRSCDGWVVELVDTSGQSLTEKLVELGFAIALENSPFKRVVEGGRFVEGSEVSVSPTNIESPLEVWICVGDDIELVEALQDRLQLAAPKLNPMKEPVGIFAAKYSDNKWYRVIKVDDSTVRFIDYGNSDTFDASDIKELSVDFLEPAEGYAVRAELPVAEFKEEATDRLNGMLLSEDTDLEGEITAHILSVKESHIVADIFKGGKSVVDVLVDENLCQRLQTNSSGFISHINSLNDFFLQEVGCEEALETIANIMLTAESFEPVNEIQVGNLVAALCSEDGLWYRGKVTAKSEEEITILFVDYGNSAVSTEFRSLPSELVSKTPLSKHCSLKLPNGVVEWSQAALEKFIEMSADGCTQFDVKFLNNNSPATVLLDLNGNSVSENLKSLCEVVEQEIVDSENTSIDHYGYNTTVYISHINNPADFFVQQEGAEVELDVIKEELSDVSSFEAIDEVTENNKTEIVGALFTEDNNWYRAKILDSVEDGTKVLFIDYGNMAVATKFVKLPETLSNKLPLATQCTLGRENWPEEASAYLSTLVDDGNTPFLMKITKEGVPQTVSLIAENKVVEQELDKLVGQESPENVCETKISVTIPKDTDAGTAHTLDDECIKTVYLIQVNSPDDFFLHTAEATQLIGNINDQLMKAEGFPEVEACKVTEGEIVAAQFAEDDQWFRAKIIDASENEPKVYLIDYGNTAKVEKMKLLPEELLSTPPLAMHCSLRRPGDIEWSSKALETFNKLVNDEAVTFGLKILSSPEETPYVVELFINGESVAEQLVLVSGLILENQSNQTMSPNETVLLSETRTDTVLDREMKEDEQVFSEIAEENNLKERADTILDEALTIDETGQVLLETREDQVFSEIAEENNLKERSDTILDEGLTIDETTQVFSEIAEENNLKERSDTILYEALTIDETAQVLLETREDQVFSEIAEENNLKERSDTILNEASTIDETTQDLLETLEDHNSKEKPIQDLSVDSPKEIAKPTLRVVEISHFKDPNDFFVQYFDDKDELSNITKQLSQADSFEAMSDSDQLLAAKCNSDGLWYRAKILDKKLNGSKVFFVDHGNTDIASDLKKLPKYLAEMKPLAKHCCLKPPKGTWTEATKEKLSALSKIEELTFEMKVIEDGEPCVVDLFVNDRSLRDTFISDEIANDLNNEMQTMILESVEKEISSCLQNDTNDMTEQETCNFEDKASENKENDIRKITENLLLNVQDQIVENKEKEIQQITDDLMLNVQDKIVENELRQKQADHEDLANKSTASDENNFTVSNEFKSVKEDSQVPEVPCDSHFPEKENDPKTIVCSSNGNANDPDEDEEGNTKVIAKNQLETDKAFNESPCTKRRTNIDEQIVPGCISIVKPEDPIEKS